MIEENVIWNNKVARIILISLNKKEVDYSSNIAREKKIGFCSVTKNFKKLEEEELIELIKNNIIN